METTKQPAPSYDPAASKHDAAAWKQSRNGLVPAVVVGTTLEWYDVMIYAQAAAIIFPALFFPEVGPAIGTIAAFATYGVGYLARPLGAVIFGHIGDRFGRKVALVTTLLLMGGATTLIGLLPTFASIGLYAPLMLMALRLLQGLGAGAEYAGAFVMIGEMAPPKRRGYWSSIPGIGIYVGVVLSALVATTVFSAPEEWVASIGWRIPFLVSILLVIVGLFFRLRISESPVYEKLEQDRSARALPFAEVFRKTPKRLFLAVLLTAPIGWNSYVSLTYSISYAKQIGYDSSNAILGTLVASVLAIILVPITGWLTDNVGRRPIYIGICVVGMVTAYPFFMLLQSGSIIALYCAHILMVFGVYIITGAQAAYLTELFPAEFRYTGVALSREISTALLAAPAPAAAAALYLWSGGPWWTAGIMVLCSAACLIAVWVLPETKAINMNYTAADLAQAKA